MHEAAARQLAKVKLAVDPGALTESLTFAQRQMVELAKVLTLEEERSGHLVIMLDEPTSVLEQAEIDILFARVRELRSRASFVFVSHRLDEIMELSDRIYVMKDGAVVAEMPAAEATSHRLHELMVGRSRNAEYYREQLQQPHRPEVVLSARGLALEGAYHDVDFELHAGEVLGIAGVIGSGREELSRTLGGLAPATSGELTVFGKPHRLAGPGEAVGLGIGYVPRERRVEGIIGFLPVFANISGLQIGYLFGSAIFSEIIFNWPGIGLQLYDSILARDVPMIQGCVLVVAIVFVLGNLLSDVVVHALDPKQR